MSQKQQPRKYLISKDNGNNWTDALTTKDKPNSIALGYIDNFQQTNKQQYQSSDVSVYRVFDLGGKIIVPTINQPQPPTPTPTLNSLFTIDVLNFSNESDSDIQKWTNACKKQADRDISKYWSYTIDVNYIPQGGKPTSGHAYMGIFNDSDQAGVLGWHDVGPNNEPLLKIFTKESEKFGLSPSGTISHEIAESIGDANANTTIQGYDESGKPCLYFQENCDPVENELYDIDGVQVSNFVTPAWFRKIGNAPYDFLNKVTKPFQILNGGYMEISYDQGNSWTQVDKFSKHSARHQLPNSRWQLYKTPIVQRKKSTFQIV